MAMAPGHRIGLMGGTFNPVHLGHLRAAEEIAESLGLDQVCFMPSASPPHKSPEPLVDYGQRLEMLKLALADRPGFWASDLEQHLPAPSYTVNSVRAFKKAWSASTEIFFLVGLDSFMTLAAWREYRELLQLASFVVFGRAGITASFADMRKMLRDIDPQIAWNAQAEQFTASGLSAIHFHPGGKLAISSTDLRARLTAGASVRYLVPEAVRVYIEKNGLYCPEKRPQ